MHELRLDEAIVEAVERRAPGKRASGVRVDTLHRAVEPALDQAFAIAAIGTVTEDTKLLLGPPPLAESV